MDNVKHGFWIDHNRTGFQSYQYLVSDHQATTASNAIAVALTLALPRLYILFTRSVPTLSRLRQGNLKSVLPTSYRKPLKFCLDTIRICFHRRKPTPGAEETPIELGQGTYPTSERAPRRILNGVLQTLESSSSTEDAVSRLARRHLAMPRLVIGDDFHCLGILHRVGKNFTEDPKAFFYILAFMVFFFAICIGLQITAISSSYIIGDSTAIINSGACSFSFTNLDDHEGSPSSDYFQVLTGVYRELTNMAIDYAESCYSARSAMAHCRELLTPTLTYSVINNTNCPFPSKDMCKLGDNSGISFDTGFLSSKILGINTGSTLEFRRRTTCAPLNDNETYVEIRNISESAIKIRYKYDDAGPTSTDRFLSFGESRSLGKDQWPEQDYNVWISQSPSSFAFGRLHPCIVSRTGATTLFFVRKNNNLLYSTYSNDSIFPATSPVRVRWSASPRWQDSSIARKVLGCSDEKLVRDLKSQSEWYILDEKLYDQNSNHSWDIRSPTLKGSKKLPLSDRDITELRLIALLLRFSDSAHAVHLARSQWLDVSLRVVEDLQSLPLDPHQWQLESRKLFNISLARLQTEIWHMARGERFDPRSSGGYDMFDNSSVDPCSMIKIKANGVKNISVMGFVAMLGIALSLWVLTMETHDTLVLFWLFQNIVKPAVSGFVFASRVCWIVTVNLTLTLWSRTAEVLRAARHRSF